MMKVSEALREIWSITATEAFKSSGYYSRRMDEITPVGVYAGIIIPSNLRQITIRFQRDAFGSRALAQSNRGYIVAQEVDDGEEASSVSVHVSEAIPKLPQEIFLVFCSDVIESVARAQTESTAADILQTRLSHWRSFFQSRGQSALSREDYVGLYGELNFLTRCLDADIPSLSAVQSWNGPFGANQDFLFGATAVEAKATTSNDPDVVRINNARQLDDLGLDALYLTHSVYDFRPDSGQTLLSSVSRIRDRLKSNTDALAIFNDRLSLAGITDIDLSDFAAYGFTIRKQRDYKVGPQFPRVIESSLAPGISDISYLLHLSAANSFALEPEALIVVIRACTGI